jgi:hypothetical protein
VALFSTFISFFSFLYSNNCYVLSSWILKKLTSIGCNLNLPNQLKPGLARCELNSLPIILLCILMIIRRLHPNRVSLVNIRYHFPSAGEEGNPQILTLVRSSLNHATGGASFQTRYHKNDLNEERIQYMVKTLKYLIPMVIHNTRSRK